jgi:hypothetical protein
MGRPPTPTSLKILRGNPGCRPINSDEPTPPVADTTAPSCLDVVGLEKWNEIAPLLAGMRVFTQIDRSLLERYCILHEQWVAVSKHVREQGMTQITSTGYSQITAEGALFKSLPGELLRIEQQFGMTPAARSTMKVNSAAAKENPLTAYISKRSS